VQQDILRSFSVFFGMLSDRCPICPVLSVCLPVTLMYCGQTAGCIKMPLGTKEVLSPGDIVLDGDPAPPAQSVGTAAPHFVAHALWPKGWMDQDATWYGCGQPICFIFCCVFFLTVFRIALAVCGVFLNTSIK